MNLCKRSAIWVCLTIAVSASPVWAQVDRGQDPEARAAGRAEAKSLVVEYLQERSVRAVEPAVVERDAARIVKRLTDEQVEALLAGEKVAAVLTPGSPKRAAAAVTEGGSLNLVTAGAVGDADSDLLYVPLDPCRIIDTRFSVLGKMEPTVVRNFKVVGTSGFEAQGGLAGGCGVPAGAAEPVAAAVMLNIVAVDAEGGGNMRAWEFNQPMPNASSINYQQLSPVKMNIANGLIVPIYGVSDLDFDLSVMASQNRVHLIADVSGYFTRFPIEQFQGGLKSELITRDFTTLTDMSDGTCKELNFCTVTTGVAGKVVVEAWGQFVVDHDAGTLDRVVIGVETATPVTCGYNADSADASDFEVSAALGSNPDVDFTVSHGRAFNQPGNTTQTYYLSGRMLSGANIGDKIENSRLICTFIPD